MSLFEYCRVNKYKIFKTLLTYITFACLGGVNTLISSSLLDIQLYVKRSYEATGRIIQTRAIGYVIGATADDKMNLFEQTRDSIVGSVIECAGFFEKYFDDSLVLSASNLVAGIFLILAPWFKTLEIVMVLIFIVGFAYGVLAIYCNVIILRIWGKNGVNWLQVLHMSLVVGGLIGPIITRPFLLPIDELDDLLDLYIYKVVLPTDESETINPTNVTSIMGPINGATQIRYSPDDVKVQYAYLIVGMVLAVVAIPYFFCYLCDRKQKSKVEEKKEVSQYTETSTFKKCFAVLIVAALANFAFGTEAVMGGLSTTFVLRTDVHMNLQKTTLLVTVYMAIFAFYRLFFIASTLVIKESRLFYMNLLIILAGVFVMTPKAASKELFTWISFTLLGIGYSPVFAISYGSLGRYFPVTNAMTSFIFVSGVLGEAIHTLIMSKTIETNPVVFTYYIGGMGIIYVMLSVLLNLFCQKVIKDPKKKIESVSESNEMRNIPKN